MSIRKLSIFIFVFLTTACSRGSSQSELQLGDNLPPGPKLLLFVGESNSGGQVLNSNATPSELGPRKSVQILHNYSLQFQDLHIGENNLIGHTGLEGKEALFHGLELGIANKMDVGLFLQSPLYLVKCGQGGSKVICWKEGNVYNGTYCWDTLVKRVDTAISLIQLGTGKNPQIIVFYTQGINDAIAPTPTPVTTWKEETKDLIVRIRKRYGSSIPFVITKFETPIGPSIYNDYMDEIAGELPDIITVSTKGIEIQDEHHWSYNGMKTLSGIMINALLMHYITK